MGSLAASHRASIGAAPMPRLALAPQTRIAAAQYAGRKARVVRLSANADPAAAAAAAAAAEQGVEGLCRADLVRTLRLRGLSPEGSDAELQQRLAAYLSDPSSFPEARYHTQPVTLLGGRLFAGRTTLRSHIQLLLNVLLGEDIREGHPDFDFLLALLQQHPRYAVKVQAPVEAFRVQLVEEADLHPLRFFEFLDAKGQWDDFSYRKCIGMHMDHNSDLSFRDAMRYAITDQLATFRMASTKTGVKGQQVHLCDCCGKRMRDGRQLRVVHVNPSFRQVVRDFVASTSLTPPPVDGNVPNSKRRCFTDEAWLAEWRAFHRKNVQLLQLACPKCAHARKAADAAAEAGGQEQPAAQQWQAWTVQRQDAAPAERRERRWESRQEEQQERRWESRQEEQRERRWESRQEEQREPRQERQWEPQQMAGRSPPGAQDGRRPQRAAEQGWQQGQEGQERQRVAPQQRVEGRGQWRAPGDPMEQQEADVEQRRLPAAPVQQQRAEGGGQWRAPAPRAESPAQGRELRRSPSPPPRERRAPQQWRQRPLQDDWLAGLAGWEQQVAGEAKQWEDWGQQPAHPQAAARVQPGAATSVPRRTAGPAQQPAGQEQQAQQAARAARQQALVQRTAQQRAVQQAALPAVQPAPSAPPMPGGQQQAEGQQPQVEQQAAAQGVPHNPALAPDAFSSAETDAWLSGSS